MFAYGRFRCLAHIINLATQALIATRSKAKYYNPHDEEDLDIDEENVFEHDEVGLVRKICVKVCHHCFLALKSNQILYRLVHRRSGRRPSRISRKTRRYRLSNFFWTWRCDGARHMSCWTVQSSEKGYVFSSAAFSELNYCSRLSTTLFTRLDYKKRTLKNKRRFMRFNWLTPSGIASKPFAIC